MTIDRAYSDYRNADMAKASSGQMTHKGPSAEVVGSYLTSVGGGAITDYIPWGKQTAALAVIVKREPGYR